MLPKREIIHRRSIVKPEFREQLLDVLKDKLKDPKFFLKLKPSKGQMQDPRQKVRVFKFSKTKIVIKDTKGETMHGFEHKSITKAISAHSKAVRDGIIEAKSYTIGVPKIYGRIGNFLVMEHVKPNISSRLNNIARESMESAKRKLEENLSRLLEKKHIMGVLQIRHIIPLGNTNPKQPEKGKWIFFLPYDYV